MADRISPPSKPVARKDGIKMGSANSTLTTPNPTFGKYIGNYTPGSAVKEGGSLFGKK